MATLHQVVVDCAQAPQLARFWAAALDGYRILDYDDDELDRLAGLGHTPDSDPVVLLDGPGPELCFQQVPEPKATKNRVHFDITPTDRAAEVTRLLRLGASVVDECDEWTTLADPEGNEFCVTDPPTGDPDPVIPARCASQRSVLR